MSSWSSPLFHDDLVFYKGDGFIMFFKCHHLVRRLQRQTLAAIVGLSSTHYIYVKSSSLFHHQSRTLTEEAKILSVKKDILKEDASSPSDSKCDPSSTTATKSIEDDDDEEEELFENQCLKRQMYIPKYPYPAWDYNWDGRETPEISLEGHKQGLQKNVMDKKNKNKTRHIILVRHGQYYDDESVHGGEDHLQTLTPLGRLQAIKTGKRLKEIMLGVQQYVPKESFRGQCQIRAIHVSNMTRAKETATYIATELGISVNTPDPDLNEALPAPMIPIRPDIPNAIEEIDQHHTRIERAFQRYFYRDTTTTTTTTRTDDTSAGIEQEQPLNDDDEREGNNNTDIIAELEEDLHEFEIIVCHGNVIRYMFCRALQLPPEAWLRMSTFNCSLTYLMIRPTGGVSCRMLGDIGHLKYDESTFSGYHGFKWS